MRTIIRGGWVVGFNGSTHTLIRNGVLVYEGKRIVYVGSRYDGPFDAEIDASRQARCAWLHRRPCARRRPCGTSPDQRRGPAGVFRHADPRRRRQTHLPQFHRLAAIACARRVGRGTPRAPSGLHGGGAAAQRHYDIRRVRSAQGNAGGDPPPGRATRIARLPRCGNLLR